MAARSDAFSGEWHCAKGNAFLGSQGCAFMHAVRLFPLPVPLMGSPDRGPAGVFLDARARRGETCFVDGRRRSTKQHNYIATRTRRPRTAQFKDSDSDGAEFEAAKGPAMCRSFRTSLVIARIEATPPQRVDARFHWTPACRARNYLANHMAKRILQQHACVVPYHARPLADRC